jgi:DNA-directed RNA polymerase subunit M/transcription elongation factor TFIIS
MLPYCPKCNTLLEERYAMNSPDILLKCPKCGYREIV